MLDQERSKKGNQAILVCPVTGLGHQEKIIEFKELALSAGAQIIDINLDEAMLDSKMEMRTFLNLLSSEPDICRVPVMIDSSKWEIIGFVKSGYPAAVPQVNKLSVDDLSVYMD